MSDLNAEPVNRQSGPLVAGLDIGTTKVVCIIGVVSDNNSENSIEIIGVGKAPTSGMKQGAVVNIEATTQAIKKAKEEAELMAGEKVSNVWLSVGGSHTESFASQGMVAIRNKEVSEEDIARVIETARAVALPSDRQVLHVLPNDYTIDHQKGISDPIGMSGVRLESSVHIVTASKSAVQNAIRCVENAGLKVSGYVLEQLASALATLSSDERSMGVTVIDIGGGTCDLISYSQGRVAHTGVIPVGGQNFTQDVAMGLRTTQLEAETLKKKYGCALPEMVSEGETIDAEGVGGRPARTLARRDLCQILEARSEETLKLIKNELDRLNLSSQAGSGVVLTGGSSQLPGLVEMGGFIFDAPVRRGTAIGLTGLTDVVKDSSFSTAVGLLKYAQGRVLRHKKGRDKDLSGALTNSTINDRNENRFGRWLNRAKEYFSSVF